jgi:glycosyltransferase involved in cell wall biosynthesis
MREPPLRVLAVTNMYPTAATPTYGTFIAAQMRSIAEAGAEVQVEFVDGRQGMWRYATMIPKIRRLAHSGRFDLVHAHYGLAGFVAAFQSKPLVVSFCGDDLLGTPTRSGRPTLKSWLAVRISHLAARRADAIICKSHEMRSRLRLQKDRDRAHVIPNGVDDRLFAPGDRRAARQLLGVDSDERLVLFPTVPTERRKRHDLAEAAITVLRGQGIAVRLWVVNGVQPDRMPDYYRAADCLVLTSDWEGSPNVVKEALACDLPVVSVEAGDVRQWLALVPGCRLVPREPVAIAAGIRGVIIPPTRIDGTPVREALALRRVAARVMEVYAGVLGRRPNRVRSAVCE